MMIESLGIEYNGEVLITDVDDCLIETSTSVVDHGYTLQEFWFNAPHYNSCEIKTAIFQCAQLTQWGSELIRLIGDKKVSKIVFLSSAKGREGMLISRFGVGDMVECGGVEFLTGYDSNMKIEYLNSISSSSIYVDDRINVIGNISNYFVNAIQYPIGDIFSSSRRGRGGRRRRR
jgi:hypothetical protein